MFWGVRLQCKLENTFVKASWICRIREEDSKIGARMEKCYWKHKIYIRFYRLVGLVIDLEKKNLNLILIQSI